MAKIAVIGAGFSGLSAASYLAKTGHEVTVYEKNEGIGGRARQLKVDGFTFDMGPSWYWMPDVIERFFNDFGKSASDYYQLERLDPGYEVYFGVEDSIKISASKEKIFAAFEKEEYGSSRFLKKFLDDSAFNYQAAMSSVVYKPGKSPLELVTWATVKRIRQFFTSISGVVRKHIKSEKLAQILEFPVLFLGAKPEKTPAFYCLMNHADMNLGTWYIKGGFFELVKAMASLAESLGVKIETNSPVSEILLEQRSIKGILVNGKKREVDFVISSADYHHTEMMLDKKLRNYSDRYWKSRVMAPSALLFYVGFDRKIKNVSHHTLFFDTSFKEHASKIYDNPGWPEKPLFYASFTSITDTSVAPEGKENAVFLIPLAPGIDDTPELRDKYFDQIINRMEKMIKQNISDAVILKKSYCISDFERDYNAFRGNAYGLANILLQTGFLKPRLESKKIRNLMYTGQLSVPGPGVPPSLISGKIAAELVLSKLKKLNS
ncbi:MAG: phytoene desaturase [Bacteroidota bacterium]|nr:MAG: phytoene desaturase [Bacteroidota bacterium]